MTGHNGFVTLRLNDQSRCAINFVLSFATPAKRPRVSTGRRRRRPTTKRIGTFQAHAVGPRGVLGKYPFVNRRFRGCSQIMVVKTPVQLPFEVIAICCLHQPNWWAMIPVPTAQPIAGSHPICAHRRHQRYRPPSFAPADSVAATNTIAMPRRRPCTNRKQWTARPGVIEPRTNAGYVSSPWLSPFCILI